MKSIIIVFLFITKAFLCLSQTDSAVINKKNDHGSQSPLTKERCDSIQNDALKNNEYGKAINCLLDFSKVKLRNGSIDSAMILVFEARNLTLKLEESKSLYYSAACNQLLGDICYTRFIEDESLGFYFLALSQYRQAGDITGVAEVLNAIAITAIGIDRTDISKNALNILSDISKLSTDPYIKALEYEACGDLFDAEGKSREAVEMFKTAGSFFNIAGKKERVSDVILSRAISEFYSGNKVVALALTDSAKQLNKSNQLRRNYLEAVYYQAEFIGQDNPSEGIKIIRGTLSELYQSKLNIHLGIYLRLMIRLQKKTGDFEGALKSTEEFHRVLDDIYGSDAERKIASLQLEVETGKLNHHIGLLEKEQELISLNSRSQRNMLFYFFLAIIVLFTMALNNMRRLQYRLYLLKEFALDFPLLNYFFAFFISLLYYSTILVFVNPINLAGYSTAMQWIHYGLIGFIISALTTASVFMLPTQWSAKPGFNKRFTATALVFIVVINAVVILFSYLSGAGSNSWVDYLNIILVITGITIIPLFFIIIYLEKVLLRKHIQLAGLLSNRIHSATVSDSSDLIEIYSDRSKDVLKIPATDFIMIEAAGNYAKVCYKENNNVKVTLILATMKLLESQLSGHPQFSRCHKSYIVNLKKVSKVLGNSHGYRLEMPEIEQQVPVSRSYAETFIKSFDKVFRER
ncbi:MAG: hypothetical protein A2W93_08405 [Bacteroidetes bacterium GWF2_43_63]|nr:MAG: hypothetical protein A2W94_15995 [Bacteroidetes bacterium GWE2_42_42]OFY53983.1 MAG: hypothetical protein A2W93_08405 [Bacteroidetes bacterium GWF2_43_63]HBG70592.1 hypothetical protein [Bacteroidales bacterium]HCB61462.1 hypothetical protein [Bacteroidales bacterium]HCY22052.1 hypothetical protein [Bacteroidales bacterium]